MTIPVAPNTITVGVSPTESVFNLVDLASGKVTYRASKVHGVDITVVKGQPVLTFSRREPTPGQVTRRYETKVQIPAFDLLGTFLGNYIVTKDNVIPMTVVAATPGYGQISDIDLPPILDEVMAAPEFQEAINALTFVR